MNRRRIDKPDLSDLTYLDESVLSQASEDEELQELYEVGFALSDFAREEDRVAYVAFLRRKGYEIPEG